jgi:hypothetical protein
MGVIFIFILAVMLSVPAVRHLEAKPSELNESQAKPLNL